MISKPASVTNHLQEPDRDEPLEAAKIPLKNKGLDIASQMRSVKQARPDLARMAGQFSTSVEQTLNVISAIEATLQHKRRQFEEIQARQEMLALEYRQLGGSLDTATKDLAQQFADTITDLETVEPVAKSPSDAAPETDKPVAKPPADEARETSEIGTETPADKAPETSEIGTEPPADSTPETGAASGLDLEASDLPPVPEFLGDRKNHPDHTGDGTPRDTGSGTRAWWKHGKKG